MNTILIISSHEHNLVPLYELLTAEGYAVLARQDGASALAAFRQGFAADVVIMDYRLPDMDGSQFFASLRQITAAPPPAIFLSDRVDINEYLRAFSSGAFEFLFRPVHPRELLRIVPAALNHCKQRSALPAEGSDVGCRTETGSVHGER